MDGITFEHSVVRSPATSYAEDMSQASVARVLAGRLAHDFNNVLQPSVTLAELAFARLEEDLIAADDLRRLQESLAVGGRLTAGLSVFANGIRRRETGVDLGVIVEHVIEGVGGAVSFANRGAGLRSVGNPAEMRLVIEEVLQNAIDASPAGLPLYISLAPRTVSTSETGETMLGLVVRDYGHGMETDVLDQAFDPLFTTKTWGLLRGLGLAIVERAVVSLGGTVVLESAAMEGTRVELVLPLIGENTDG